MATLLRFKTGTKGFHRQYNTLLLLIDNLKQAYSHEILKELPEEGLRLGIIDDSPVHKTGKNFPKQQIQHDHNTNTFFPGMRILSTGVYQKGKFATVSSKIIGKEDNKLNVAKDDIDMLVNDFLVDVILFDSWSCKSPVIEKIIEHEMIFISRLRCDSKVIFDDGTEMRLDHLAKNLSHSQYNLVKIRGKSYWICDMTLDFKSYGKLRVIISKEGQYKESVFLTTNSENFSALFIVKLYLRRFSIEIFFKDAKQYLNFETFLCRPQEKWNLHLCITNILHWCIQKKKSISRTVRKIRENIDSCLLFINENRYVGSFFEELMELGQT